MGWGGVVVERGLLEERAGLRDCCFAASCKSTIKINTHKSTTVGQLTRCIVVPAKTDYHLQVQDESTQKVKEEEKKGKRLF